MSQEPTYADYVKEAFNLKVPVPGLGSLPLNWMALGTLGVLSVWLWPIAFIAAGLEVAFLTAVANHPRFQSYVRGKRLLEAKAATEQTWSQRIDAVLERLTVESRERFARLVANTTLVEDSGALITEVARDGLEHLQWIHVRLLESREKLARQIDHAARARLSTELQASRDQLAALGEGGDERIKRSVASTIDILERRVANLDAAIEDTEFINAELKRIEHQAELIVEESALSKDATSLSHRIDAVTATLDETRQWMSLHKELFHELGDEDEPVPPPPRLKAT